MLDRLRGKTSGIDTILEVAGATMVNLGANLAGIFDAEGAKMMTHHLNSTSLLSHLLAKKERHLTGESI